MLFVHNSYKLAGGEDQVFTAESSLLEERGHGVLRYMTHNDRIEGTSSVELARSTLWNGQVYREVRALIRAGRPRIVHFHNTFPLISPAAYYAAHAEGVAVVQTLHNYRLLCPNALFFRGGRACEDCLGRAVPYPGVLHACYRGSRPASAGVAALLTVHRGMGTWTREVDAYIALTEFARGKFVQGGLPREKIVVKPNFVGSETEAGEGKGGYALFVGRLSQEKGIDTLLAAWERLRGEVPLKIVGDGPLAPDVARAAGRLPAVEYAGRQPKDRVLGLMRDAAALIFPSLWYEGFPMVIAESYAAGLPVFASDLGSMSSLVRHGRTGLRFRPGDPGHLADTMRWAREHPTELARMRVEARAEFEAKYTAERSYRSLLEIYDAASRRAAEAR